MASKAAAAPRAVVDFSRIISTYGLGKETLSTLSSFRKRASDAATANALLVESKRNGTIDFAHYRSVLKNSAVVDEIEQALKNFKPVTIDAGKEIKAIEAFEAKAIADAEATVSKIDTDLVDLKKTLDNIKSARPVEDLMVQDVVDAMPEIQDTVDVMVSKGKFDVPGFKAKFGDYNVL